MYFSQFKATFKIAVTIYSFLQDTLEYKTEQKVKGFSLRCLKRKPLTSSTLPNPPTPSVAIISRFWNGDDEENLATFSLSWIISRESVLDRFRWDMDLLLKRSDMLHTPPWASRGPATLNFHSHNSLMSESFQPTGATKAIPTSIGSDSITGGGGGETVQYANKKLTHTIKNRQPSNWTNER